MTDFKWTISAFDREPENKIITSIHWRLSAERDGINVETYGCTPLPIPSADTIDYDMVTKEKSILWLESIMSIVSEDMDGIKQPTQLETVRLFLENAIDKKLNPISEKAIPNFN